MNTKKDAVYITTTLPYVNADPHIGFALEIIQADVWARLQQTFGRDVFFNTGTDEHGQKIHTKALEKGIATQAYVDEYAEKFKGLIDALGILPSINFIRTTDTHHKASAQEFWKRCFDNGFIYKKPYKVKYCVGCELEKTDSELVDGFCPLHPTTPIEEIEEENYFFAFSKFQEQLLALYEARPDFVVPTSRFNEIKAFVARGLQDFSISRLKSKMPWGVPVPNDDEQVMYVWFDALVNYISAIGWPQNTDTFTKYWPAVQVAGKDNLRQQSAMWQAMLMAAGLPPSQQIMIHGFIGNNGQKMSKSLGNVVNPYDIIAEYGTDALRFYLLSEIHPFEDSDYSAEKFKEVYNAQLANGVGNLTSRIMKLAETYLSLPVSLEPVVVPQAFSNYISEFEYQRAMKEVVAAVTSLDSFMTEAAPFKVVKVDVEQGRMLIAQAVARLYELAVMLQIIMPQTAEKMIEAIRQNKMPSTPLFMRKD